MKGFKKVILGMLTIALAAAGANGVVYARDLRKAPKAKNIIFMVPDGMGLSNTTAARIFANGPDGARLDFETLENIGYQSTHSANATVTDSAAAASAWAMGEKFDNGEISCHGIADTAGTKTGECVDNHPTILELAAQRGKTTGLVATSQISHATPAVFGAHTFSRNCGAEIARQYIEVSKVDVILGGSVYKTVPECNVYPDSFAPADKVQYIEDLAVANGYALAGTRSEMSSVAASGRNKVLGMFTGAGKTPEYFRVDPAITYPEEEPTLAEMTDAALDILEENRKGFFLMVEGSQIDWEDHANQLPGQIAETLGFNEAVKVVLDWIDAEPNRKRDTLVVVVADHDTGGFAINGPGGTLSQPGDIVEAGWTSGNHTAVDTIIYSQGPGGDLMNAALDNTDLYHIMKQVMR